MGVGNDVTQLPHMEPRMAPNPAPHFDSVDEPRTGTFIGPWRVERLLGRGAAARVYEVRHAVGGGRAALKLLSPAHAASPYLRERFAREGIAANHIVHPGVVITLDVGEAGGRPYFVMELVEGPSVAKIWRAAGIGHRIPKGQC